MKTIQIQMTISTLQEILENARESKKIDGSLSNTILIQQLEECETFNGNDKISAIQLSSYQDGIGKQIYLSGF